MIFLFLTICTSRGPSAFKLRAWGELFLLLHKTVPFSLSFHHSCTFIKIRICNLSRYKHQHGCQHRLNCEATDTPDRVRKGKLPSHLTTTHHTLINVRSHYLVAAPKTKRIKRTKKKASATMQPTQDCRFLGSRDQSTNQVPSLITGLPRSRPQRWGRGIARRVGRSLNRLCIEAKGVLMGSSWPLLHSTFSCVRIYRNDFSRA